jgi:acyl-CoA synthetase (AMP-forming)/AMP-acid ligase II
MVERTTLADLLADAQSPAPAIIASASGAVVSYKDLAAQVDRMAVALRGAGLAPGDCVCVVLPNGLEFLVVFLALVRARLVAAPLNPAYKTDELVFFMQDAQARAVIADPSNAARDAAVKLGLPLWPMLPGANGTIEIEALNHTARDLTGILADAPQGEDVALFLHTSGTTSRPKGVPLTHANVLCSSLAIARHYALAPQDRSLVVMPLFHVHGLIGATLSTLASGGVVIVPPRFSASEFWPLAHEHRATWYSAVPTIHQVLLARADGDRAPRGALRFIRSCSAALAPATLEQLERRFEAPVLEAYGMTEAAHQVASNPLPPSAHKAGTVGCGTAEVAIIDEAGRHLSANTPGEVAIRGPSVMRGYRNNAQANADAFVDGWFRTGDRGLLDDDGYLTLIGRIKELINRAGEKISPAEVDAVLLEHPAVAEAAAFGVPDAKYGEEVWAAVVLKADADAQELRAHCGRRLADFKLPKAIHVVAALPKGATGKIQRRDLAAMFKGTAKS